MKTLLYMALFINTFALPIAHAGFWDIFKDSRAKVNICYFSLNNGDEYDVTESFVDDINVSKNYNIEVHEFQGLWSNPEESFKEMVESGVKCDGLVISGHHTSSFGGKRARGQLSIDFMEGLNCNETSYKWFKHVKSLWLQGCRTLGGEIVGDQDAEYHADRVSAVLEVDHLQLTREELSRDFSALLDNSNPLSTRYARIFPNATLFGWTATAPGERWGSEKSLVYHIANVAQIQKQDIPIEDPFDIETDKEKKFFNDNLLAILLRDDNCDPTLKSCFESSEELYIQAWINHGHEENFTYAYMNDELDAYPSLFGKGLYTNKKVKDIELEGLTRRFSCSLKNNQDHSDVLNAIKGILGNKEVLKYTSSLLTKYISGLEKYEKTSINSLIAKSEDYFDIMSNIILSNTESLGSKFDYYSVYLDIVKENKIEDIKLSSTFKDAISSKLLSVIEKSKSRTNTDLNFIVKILKKANDLKIWKVKESTDQQLRRNTVIYNHFLSYLDAEDYMAGNALNRSYDFLTKTDFLKLKNKVLERIKKDLRDPKSYYTASDELSYFKQSYRYDNLNDLIDLLSIKSSKRTNNEKIVNLLITHSDLNKEDEFFNVYSSICVDIKRVVLGIAVTSLNTNEQKILDILRKGINHERDSLIYKEMLLGAILELQGEYGYDGSLNLFLGKNGILSEIYENLDQVSFSTRLNLTEVSGFDGQQTFDLNIKEYLTNGSKEEKRSIMFFVLRKDSRFKKFSRDNFLLMLKSVDLSAEDVKKLYESLHIKPESVTRAEYIFSLAQLENSDMDYLAERGDMTSDIFFDSLFSQKLVTQKNYKILLYIIERLKKNESASVRLEAKVIEKKLFQNSELKKIVLDDLKSSSVSILEKLDLYRLYTSLSPELIDNSLIFDIESLIAEVVNQFDSLVLDSSKLEDKHLVSIIKLLSFHNMISDYQFNIMLKHILEHENAFSATYLTFLELIATTDRKIENINELLVQLLERIDNNGISNLNDLIFSFYKNTNRSRLNIDLEYTHFDYTKYADQVKTIDQIDDILLTIYYLKEKITALNKNEWMNILFSLKIDHKPGVVQILPNFIKAFYSILLTGEEKSDVMSLTYTALLQAKRERNNPPYGRFSNNKVMAHMATSLNYGYSLEKLAINGFLDNHRNIMSEKNAYFIKGLTRIENTDTDTDTELVEYLGQALVILPDHKFESMYDNNDNVFSSYRKYKQKNLENIIKTSFIGDLDNPRRKLINNIMNKFPKYIYSNLAIAESFDLSELENEYGFFDTSMDIQKTLTRLKYDFSSREYTDYYSRDVRNRIFMINLKFDLELNYEKLDKEAIVTNLYEKYNNYLKYPRSFFENHLSKNRKAKLLKELSLFIREVSLTRSQVKQLEIVIKTVKSFREFRAGPLDYK